MRMTRFPLRDLLPTSRLRPALLRPALALTLLASASSIALAQDAAPLTGPAAYAPAALRQDIVAGAYEVVAAPALGQVFVASAPGFEGNPPGYVHVLDPTDLHQIRRLQLPRRAFALALDQTAGRLYVGNTLDGSISVVDAASGMLMDTIQLGKPDGEGFEHTRMIQLDEANGLMFVSSPTETGTLWIVDTRSNALLHRIDNIGVWAAGLAYDPAAGQLYVGGGGPEEISVVDVKTGQRVAGLSTGDTPADAAKEDFKHFFVNLDIDGAGQRLFAADANSGQLYAFDLATGKVLGTVPVGMGALDVAYNAARDEIYLTWRGASHDQPNGTGGLAVIDGKDLSLRQNLSLPVHPNSLGLGDKGEVLYVTVKVPHQDGHPDFRAGAADSVLRFDLAKLSEVK